MVDGHRLSTMDEDRWALVDERELIDAACRDMDAFAALYNRYRPRVFAYLLTYTTTIEDAADLTQYVFVRVLEALPSYCHGSTPLSAWLFRIARNAAIDAYRRRRRVLPWDHLPETLRSWPAEGPETASLHADDLNRLRLLVSQLDRNKQELLALRFAADLTIVEIAALLGKRESAVQKRLSRTIQRLKEQFHESSV
jgi:RNA polymerase sigma-70 factor, ECF subfamily